MVHTRCKCARFFSVPSGNRSANPTTSVVSGCSGFQHFSQCPPGDATEIFAPSEEGFREVCLVVSCWASTSGHQTYDSKSARFSPVLSESYSANLAPLVFRGTAISNKFAQCPPGDIVALIDLLPPRKK
ncbi:hypothetical protein DPX16_6449 [Anabarilius grahami]|uniref:Uncharacterized protein n=1 Tax=Anabarilius grahami TaxID=495550 RepID=A0A3N0YM47_ANAGA|nr:hypothetical protein DPX16_6449 [Anabarilius grahami]